MFSFSDDPDRFLRPIKSSVDNRPLLKRYAVCVRPERLGRAIRVGDTVEVQVSASSELARVKKMDQALVVEIDGKNVHVDASLNVVSVVVAEYSEFVRHAGESSAISG